MGWLYDGDLLCVPHLGLPTLCGTDIPGRWVVRGGGWVYIVEVLVVEVMVKVVEVIVQSDLPLKATRRIKITCLIVIV